MILSRIMALMLAFGIALTATADETINDLRRETAGVRKIRQQASAMDREVQAIRELMEASGVISEESLLAVKRISTEVDSAANQSLNKALVHIAEARDNIADRITADVAHMDAARRIRKHLQDIIFWFSGINGSGKTTAFLPYFPPLCFGGFKVITIHYVSLRPTHLS